MVSEITERNNLCQSVDLHNCETVKSFQRFYGKTTHNPLPVHFVVFSGARKHLQVAQAKKGRTAV